MFEIKHIKSIFHHFFFFCLISTLLYGCQNSEPIKIGFSSVLTGRLSDLGLAGRNAVILAVEEINDQGGVDGRKVELLIKDDKQDPETAVEVDRQLIDKGVTAIIGHMTSSMSVAVTEKLKNENVLFISPTTASNQLTGINDNFLRVMIPNKQTIQILARHVFSDQKLSKIGVIYDDQNRAYSKEWADIFKEYSRKTGASIIATPFISEPGFSFSDLTQKVLADNPDGILVVAAALDAAMICQQVRKSGATLPIFATMWSMTEDFLQHGGRTTEGVTFVNWFIPDHPAQSSQIFQEKYYARFNKMPSFASHFAYESATILIEALYHAEKPEKIKEYIINKRTFKGTQGTIEIDQFGDAIRDVYIMTVKNNGYTLME